MRRHLLGRFPRPAPATVIVIAALVLAAGGFAVAAIPAADGTIHGCYATNGGQFRIVKGTKCKQGEKALSWNKHGPASVKVRSTVAKVHYTSCTLFGSFYSCTASARTVTAHCHSGERATGGGYGAGSGGASAAYSYPFPTTGTPTGWTSQVSGFTTSATPTAPDGSVTIYALCIA